MCSFVILSLVSFGQKANDNSVSLDAKKENVLFETYLKQSSKPSEAFIDVKKTKNLVLKISTSLIEGRFKLEIYDPTGKKRKKDLIIDSRLVSNLINFSHTKDLAETDSVKDTKPKTVGNIYMALRKPKSGQWRVKIVPVEATGNVQISYSCKQ